MDRQFQCPSCGAANTVTNPGILMRICDYCKTSMYWDKESVLRAGDKSVDLPRSARFKIGATGTVKGQSFRVLGRLSYAHDKGTWDEWFVAMDDGQIKWLSEDEGELFLEAPLELTVEVPPHQELKPGMRIVLNDQVGVVEEVGTARCLGGQGEIPFVVEIGETYPYADGSYEAGGSSFGLEYDTPEGAPRAFVGQAILLKSAKAAPAAHEEADTRTGELIRCPSCGKPYEGARLETTEMVVCEACGSGLQLGEAEARVVGKNAGDAPKLTFPIGCPLLLEGVRYEVMGRLLYSEKDEDGEYLSREYILYHPEKGYLWLSEDDGHFTISEPTHQRVVMPPIPVARMKVQVGQETFQVYESGTLTLRWVDGALPWIASVGEETQYVHLIKPPDYVDQEKTGGEVEFFRGRYVGRDEMKEAAPKGIGLPRARGVFSCRPFVTPVWLQGATYVGIAFLIINLLLYALAGWFRGGKPVIEETITADKYLSEYLTKPFNVPRDRCIIRVAGSAPLRNSWVALDFAVVDANEQVISEFGGDASYYSGSDSEGSWTEGSRSFATYFFVKKAGTYRLLIHGQGGTGESGGTATEPVTFRVTADAAISWYFIVAALLSVMVLLCNPISRWWMENRRWKALE